MNTETLILETPFDFNTDYIGGARLVKNKKIKGQNNNIICYSFETYAQELFNLYENGDSPQNSKKDLEKGDIINIKEIKSITDNNILTIELDCGIIVDIPLHKEKKFLERFGYENVNAFIEALQDSETLANLTSSLKVYIYETYPNPKASLWQAYIEQIQDEFLKEKDNPSQAYVAKVKEANKGGYFVEVVGIKAFMPGSLSAPNKLANFEDLLGTEVIVMIEDYIPEMNSFIVSHKKYIEYILPEKIKNLNLDLQYEGTITGTSKYGIFIEFDKIFTGLLHISKMEDQTIHEFKSRSFKSGDPIKFYINEVAKDNRLILTEKDPVEKRRKVEEFIFNNKDKTIQSKVAAIMNFGIIVSIDDQSGLIPNKEFRKKQLRPNDYNISDPIDVLFDNYTDGKITFKLTE
jgi:ribosomal protein S1